MKGARRHDDRRYAVWEITDETVLSTSVRRLVFRAYLERLSGPRMHLISCLLSLAPESMVSTASSTAPVPRFHSLDSYLTIRVDGIGEDA